MGFRQEFCYVDIHSSVQWQWKRVRLDKIDKELLGPAKYFKCFKSVQRYAKPHAEPGELVWQPVFFDLDHETDPSECIKDVKKLHSYLTQVLQIHRYYIRIYFSGKKGFHVIIEPEVFDIRPSKDVYMGVKKVAMYISELLKLETFDHKVYSTRRVLRVVSSIHQDTKLYKIELTRGELEKGIEWIREKAKRPPRDPRPEEPDEEVATTEEAKSLWDEIMAQVEEAKELSNLNPSHTIKDFGDLPVCMKYMLASKSLPTANTGNRTILSMASYLKDSGESETGALAMLIPWAAQLDNIGWGNEPDKLTAAITATVRFIYHHGENPGEEPYHFACKFLLALSTPDVKIPCQGVQCPAIKGKMQETKEIIDLQLDQFSKSIYLSELVTVPALITGKGATPFVIPKRIHFDCEPDDEGKFCNNCPIERFNGNADFEFDTKDPEILEVVGCTNKEQWAAIYRKFRFPASCRKSKHRVEEWMNIEEVRMSPAAVDIRDFERNDYVTRRGFYVGYPIQSNRRYKMTGYPVKDPKTQSSSFLFQKYERLETEVETFRMNPEMHKELEIFQPTGDQSVEEKWGHIHEDLAANVYRIWDRFDLAFAVDLVTHSVRGFKFRDEPFVKGWAEVLIVGDSGQGKTSLVQRLVQEHYRVGEFVEGGSARRTGLLYSFQESGKNWMLVWGAFALNDGGLITMDEFGDLPEDQFSVMTSVRSSGIIKATGVVTAETFARVRLIALSNTKRKEGRGGKHLAEYEYPVTAIRELVPAPEDIRRFDLALAVASGEVDVEIINSPTFKKVEHVYTPHLCRNLVRWVWSRKETNIIFEDDASRLILAEATRMSKDFYAGDIPLVEPADQRFKIARLSVACAARLFSTDKEGENIIVRDEHVGFAVTLLYTIYGKKNFRYRDWSKSQRRTDVSDTVDLEAALGKLKELQNWKLVFGLLMLPGQLDLREVENVLDGNKSAAGATLRVMQILGLVEKKWSKYTKTAKGNQLCIWAIDKGKVKREEIEQEMMGNTQPFFPHGGPPNAD